MRGSAAMLKGARSLQETLTFDDDKAESIVRPLFEHAGVTVNGTAPHDIQIHDKRFYGRMLREATLGLGESYMDGWWDSEAIDQFLCKLVLANFRDHIKKNWKLAALLLRARVLNMQNLTRSFEVGRRHYDIGNDLYTAMLDSRLVYTCAYWKDADNLEDAQEAKLDLVCRKLGLTEGMDVLELGCGWGSFAKFAAERYGARVTGFTVSKEQVALGMERCKGLPVDLRLADYRTATGTYDRVISIGIMEHIGYKNYRTYMELAQRCLRPGGRAFVHTIAGNRSRKYIDPWLDRYIFPNALLPTMTQLGAAMEGVLVLEDVQNIGPDYDHTLMAWHRNFEAAWPELSKSGEYDERFYRMWRFYLLMCASGFRSRDSQLYQLVLTPPGTPQPDCRMS